MVSARPIRTVPNNLKVAYLQFQNNVSPGETEFAWAQSFRNTKIYFMEIHYTMTASVENHLINLSLMRLPELTLNSYTGSFIHDLMLRQWSNIRSYGDFPMYSSFPSTLTIHDGEALVMQFQNDSSNVVATESELSVYYSGGTLKVLQDY